MECLFTLQSRDWILRIYANEKTVGDRYRQLQATRVHHQQVIGKAGLPASAGRYEPPVVRFSLPLSITLAEADGCPLELPDDQALSSLVLPTPLLYENCFYEFEWEFLHGVSEGVMRRGWSIICSGSASRFASKAGMDRRNCWGIQYRQRSRHTCTPFLSTEIGCRKSCSHSADALVRGLSGQAGYPQGCAADPSGAG